MNKYLVSDAISYLDADLLAEHLKKKGKLRNKSKSRKKVNILKWSGIAAACLVVVIIAVPVINNLIGYHAGLSEDEMWERSNTYFDTYEELADVIGNDTLLENIEFSGLDDYELRLKHELDNVNDFSTVSFVEIMPEDSFGIGIYFPPYEDKIADYCSGENTVTINGVVVEYLDRTEGTNYSYYYMAEFKYNGCEYVIRSYGQTNADVFWTKLTELLGG